MDYSDCVTLEEMLNTFAETERLSGKEEAAIDTIVGAVLRVRDQIEAAGERLGEDEQYGRY